jgi:flagellar basal-body rod protein FlgG
MPDALSTAALGMNAQQKMVDNIANNLANVNTTGFKRSTIAFQDLFYQTIATSRKGAAAEGTNNGSTELQIGHGARPVATIRNFSEGSVDQTGNPLDLCINGNGFFQVQMPDGSTAFTRDGNFTLNSSGEIVNNSGLPLVSNISVPQDAVGIKISQDGVVTAKLSGNRGQVDLGQIELAKFVNDTGLSAMGDNLYSKTEASGDPYLGNPGDQGFGTLQQGYLEHSNVDIVSEMVKLIEAQRAYETNSKMVQTAEQMMSVTNAIKR